MNLCHAYILVYIPVCDYALAAKFSVVNWPSVGGLAKDVCEDKHRS